MSPTRYKESMINLDATEVKYFDAYFYTRSIAIISYLYSLIAQTFLLSKTTNIKPGEYHESTCEYFTPNWDFHYHGEIIS